MNDIMIRRLTRARSWVREELDDCVSFWLEHGMDAKNGGVYTCLDRRGDVFSTDKSVWMQGRCAWTFSEMCARYGARSEWLEAAKSCIDFMEAHCINRENGNRMYFTVTESGAPLRQRRYCFSEGFYVMANARYASVSGDGAALERAKAIYELVWQINHGTDPLGANPKTIPETRTGRALADPMIYMNLSSVMRKCDPANAKTYMNRATACANDILRCHFKPEMRCTLETVGVNGELQLDTTAGRVVNPGHDIECSWFMLEHAQATGSAVLADCARDIFNFAFERGWDEQYGGLLYFVDCLNRPPEAYEHDMKLWWPHNEILIASLAFYLDTQDEKYLEIFLKTQDYCRRHFSDPEFGEWYGYLRRDGVPTEPPCKGSTFKGPFHLPRALMMADEMLAKILN